MTTRVAARLCAAALLAATQLPGSAAKVEPPAAPAAPPAPATAASAPVHRVSPYAAAARAHAEAASGATLRVSPLSLHKSQRPKSHGGQS